MPEEDLESRARTLIEKWRREALYLRGLKSASRDGQMDEYYWRREAKAYEDRAEELEDLL